MTEQINLRKIIEEIASEGVVINMKLMENTHGWSFFLIQIRGSICGENLLKITNRLKERKVDYKISAGDHVIFIETIPAEKVD